MILKQSTAATIKFGPFVDDTDGKTAETGLTIAQADIRLSKNGGDFAQTNNSAGATHDENGYYDIPLDTTDTNTLGRLRVSVSKSGALPVWQDFMVVTANVYDTLCSTSSLNVNVASLADDVITAAKFDESTAFPLKSADTGLTQVARVGADGDTLETLSDEIAAVKTDTAAILEDTGTTLDGLIKDVPTVAEFEARTKPAADYFDPATDTVANVTTVGTTTNLTNLPTMPADWITAAGLKADAVAEIQAGLALEATLTAIKGVGWTTETLAAIDALIDAIKAKTDNLPASPAPANEYDTELAAIQADLNNPDQYKADVSGIPAAVWGYATRTLSSFGTLISDIWAHATRTLSAFGFTVATQSDANVTAIKAKTDNLPASPAATGDAMTLTAAYDHAKDDVLTPLGVVDGVVDAIKLKTDNIPATPANEATLTAIKGTGWSDETLVALMNAIEAISVGSGATPQQIWEYETRTLTDASNLGLATATALATVSAYVDDLESRLTAARAGYLDKLNVTGTLANTDNANNFKADVSNLALEATLTAIKGSGWTNETLKAIKEYVDELESRLTAVRAGYLDNLTKLDANVSSRLAASGYTAPDNANILNIKAKTDNLPDTPANEATLTAMKGTGWTDETLVALMLAIEAISTGLGATPQQIWEYVARTLTNPDDYKADVSGLATTTHLQEVENKVDAVGTSVATPATVWAYPDRTLTVSSIRPRPLVDGDQFTIYKDATINIPITKLGDISVYDNLWFTIKREQDLESADDQSVVHMDLLTGMLYLNKQAAVAAQGSITIVDATTGSINILITKDGAALLPVYAREPLRWEVKGIHGEIVDILLQGSCFIQPAVSRKIS